MLDQFVTLSNGMKMPTLGLGVYKTVEPEEMLTSVRAAWDAGYQAIDTAQMYNNEQLVGDAVKQVGIPRGEIFLTSKINNCNHGYERARESVFESLKLLGTDYLDLMLIHWPGLGEAMRHETYRALEDLHKEGYLRAIGVSNFAQCHLESLLGVCSVRPVINQVERNTNINQAELIEYCRGENIQVEAWAPLIRGEFENPVVAGIAAKYGKTQAQVILRWDVQSELVVIVKSVHRERVFENAGIFDFTLSDEDMAALSALSTGKRSSPDPMVMNFGFPKE